ncbi:MAG TPA: PH domain-containing protein [Candidatus Saccharimonadales bacterium]|nr:PH domain-containing protein [Candidatus Saccharimonadales bacterium]
MAEAEQTADKPQKYFDDQFDDEEVLFVFRKHPIVMRKGLVFGLLGPLIGVLPSAVDPNLGFGVFFGGFAAGCLLGLLIFAPSWIGWHFSVFILTDQRFIQITQKGLFHRAVADLGLPQIQSVNYEVSGLQETLLGFGTIKMQTYVGDMVIHDVHHPAKIQKQILSILRDEGINAEPYPGNAKKRSSPVSDDDNATTTDNEEDIEAVEEI